MTARLPSAAGYEAQVDKEQHWLPVLGPSLPIPIPQPVALGNPDENYPWKWSVYQWIDGTPAELDRIRDLSAFASKLGHFLTALRRIDATDGPPPGEHNFYRGGSLRVYDGETARALTILGDSVNGKTASEVWDRARSSAWSGEPVWFHGDISHGNLLLDGDGDLSAVIDFGTCGVGDPACDLAIAWTLLDDDGRDAYRSTTALDDETWARGRGWAIWKALIVAAGMAGSNSRESAANARRTISRVIEDHRAAQ